MSNLDKGTKDFLIAAAIGGVLGICLASIFSSKREDRSSLSTLGQMIVQMGEMLDKRTVKHTPIIDDLEKQAHKHTDVISDVIELITAGIHLWKKLK